MQSGFALPVEVLRDQRSTEKQARVTSPRCRNASAAPARRSAEETVSTSVGTREQAMRVDGFALLRPLRRRFPRHYLHNISAVFRGVAQHFVWSSLHGLLDRNAQNVLSPLKNL
jgi:hypothetical protein